LIHFVRLQSSNFLPFSHASIAAFCFKP